MTNSLKQHSDQDLVQSFRLGDEAAITELVHRYQSNVYTSIYIMVKDKYVAEDLFQDTFLKIVNNIRNDKYSEQGKFLPWALRIAHNLCIDHFRRIKQQVRITLSDGTDFFSLLPMKEENVEERIMRQQTEFSVQQIIDHLPEEQREVVVMRIYGEMSYKQIAEITGVSINTALGRMRYALINLQKMINEYKLVLR
ncbi:sigma-70 family RNA polymerase sigma factor [Taibaiella lutea]|uniref:Sigma-70 family RNA polymerase sigma factor n=1 Tax=Taibaiella lutea TaxID=2608001 RepID=A0A5M6CT73_9BACT|nr:sigma-70 family RNA polymerase sigma factor [Taibaiella lutea]KAA5537162.1 sigma-70 family RNA polymerase sigma factor [Taibaiella lutea]